MGDLHEFSAAAKLVAEWSGHLPAAAQDLIWMSDLKRLVQLIEKHAPRRKLIAQWWEVRLKADNSEAFRAPSRKLAKRFFSRKVHRLVHVRRYRVKR